MKYPNSNNAKSWSDIIAASHHEIPPEIDISNKVRVALIMEERESNAIDWTDAILALLKIRPIRIAIVTGTTCTILLSIISFIIPSADSDEDPVIAFITSGDWSVFL